MLCSAIPIPSSPQFPEPIQFSLCGRVCDPPASVPPSLKTAYRAPRPAFRRYVRAPSLSATYAEHYHSCRQEMLTYLLQYICGRTSPKHRIFKVYPNAHNCACSMDWQQAHRGQNLPAVKTVQNDGSKLTLELKLSEFVLKNISYINNLTNITSVRLKIE